MKNFNLTETNTIQIDTGRNNISVFTQKEIGLGSILIPYHYCDMRVDVNSDCGFIIPSYGIVLSFPGFNSKMIL